MLGIGYIIWTIIITYVIIARGLPQLLSWLCQKHLSAVVKIGHIGILSLSLKDVLIDKNGIKIAIDSIGISSSLVNRAYNKLLVVYVSDVRVQKNKEPPELSSESEEEITSELERNPSKINIPHYILTLSQILSIHIYNISLMILRVVPDCLLNVTVQEICLEGATEQLLSQLCIFIRNATCKLLQSGNEESQPCLAELSFSKDLIITVDPKNGFCLKVINLHFRPEITINEGFLVVYNNKNAMKHNQHLNEGTRVQNNMLSKIISILPEKINMRVEDAKLKFLYGREQQDFICDLRNFEGNILMNEIIPDVCNVEKLLSSLNFTVSFMLQDLIVNSASLKIIAIHTTSLKIKVQESNLDVDMIVSSFTLTYHKEIFEDWLNTLSRTRKLTKTKEKLKPRNHKLSILTDFIKKSTIRSNLELWDMFFIVQLPSCSALRMGCSHSKFTIESKEFENGASFPVVPVLPSNISIELVLETTWCRLGESGLPDNHNKKHHYWNTPLFLGVLLFKMKEQGTNLKLEGMIDNIQLEYGPELSQLCIEATKFTRISDSKDSSTTANPWNYPSSYSDKNCPTISAESVNKVPLWNRMNLHVTVACVNAYAITDRKVCLMLRIDSNSLELQNGKVTLSVEGTKLLSISTINQYHPCVRSTDLRQCVLNIQNIHCTHKKMPTQDTNLQFLEEVAISWNPTFHITAFYLVQDVLQFWKQLSWSLFLKSSKKPQLEASKPSLSRIQLKFRGPVSVETVLSIRHRLTIFTSNVTCQHQKSSTNFQMDQITMEFDGHNIVTFQNVKVSSVQSCSQLNADRETFSDLLLKENKAWIVNMDSLKFCFPHDYNFGETFSEECVNVIKWLKILHNVKKKEMTLDTPLPSDLLLKIKAFTVEFCDDPFEVKLRDNYELLEDEFIESQKRWKMLDVKVEELCKTHLLLPAGKVEELYANLQKKNADIYIQRSQQLYRSTPMRTCLGIWYLEDIEILALSDLSYHGKDNVIFHMKEIDPESPFPAEGLEFSTLWCRMVRLSCSCWKYTLRDYSSPALNIRNFHLWGRLIGAEQEATKRAKRIAVVELQEPWTNMTVERSMPPLKFYHDFSCEIDQFTVGYGPCWEPTIAHLNLAMELINKPSADPSPPLPFWDKVRLLFHGRLTMFVQQMAMVLHASLNPYNTTEEMDFTWSNLLLDWTNAKIVFKGDLDVYVRTASKYDDCRLLHIPGLKLIIKLDWVCLADPNDHYAVMPCAPDKLPEYSINQEHDSFRAFRSLNLNVSVSMETKAGSSGRVVENIPDRVVENIPAVLFYSSTLRWLENLKVILSGVARPIRRGALFHNIKPNKLKLSRHYKSIRFSLSLYQFEVRYWMSFAKQRGFQLKAGKLSLSSEYNLSLVPVDDNLKHRLQAEWSAAYMNCELNDAEVWLQSSVADDTGNEMNISLRAPVERCYFLSLSRVSYGREAMCRDYHLNEDRTDTPTHRLVIHDLRGAWTKNNRNIVFGLFDSYMTNKLMRRNLSTEALKGFKLDASSTPLKSRGNSTTVSTSNSPLPQNVNSTTSIPSSSNCQQVSPANVMLQQLVAEVDSKAMVFSEDLSGGTREQQLHGVAACQTVDILHKNWLIELINSQVLLKGCETSGYVIMSAAKAQIHQRIHQPVWRNCTLVSKTTWVGSLECMQYYATVDPGELSASMDNIMWLTVDNIEEREKMIISDMADLVGSGQAVGGVISSTVGAVDPDNPVQLQRIVSRCGCQFFYASYGENVDPKNLVEVPPLPPDDSDLWNKELPVDSFTLTHHDLNCCTNSLQYAMILDIVNNLLLYVEPMKKEANEKLQRMRFQLQLSRVEDQRTPILLVQNQVRTLISNLRRLEKEMYLIQKTLDDEACDSLALQMDDLERQIYECKVLLYTQAEELNMMIHCFKEQQLSANRKRIMAKNNHVLISRWNEVCFKHAQWRLTENDGQLGIADIVLSNFLYSKQTKNDDSVQHLLELSYMKVTNLLPNQIYKEVLQPTNLQPNIPIDRQCALRIFCREKPPVGGISIKEHFEVNVVPLTLGLTQQFYDTMEKFCFPGRDAENTDNLSPEEVDVDVKTRRKQTLQQRRTASADDQDDIEKMKERAEKNKMFLYIKIPEVPVRLSFKGEKDKNIKDVQDFDLVVPTLEYHNVTWTWLDLLFAMKNDSKKALLSQLIKHKLTIKPSKAKAEESIQPQEEEKAILLLGPKVLGPGEKGMKKSLFSRNPK